MLVSSILNIIEKVLPDKEAQGRVRVALKEQEVNLEKQFAEYARMDHDLRIKEIEHTGFKASWRPYVMFGFSTVVMIYSVIYYLLPGIIMYINVGDFDLTDLPEPVEVDPALWDLVKYSILGIGGMRTVDKWRQR